jgi:PAS domain S-box-containing protein
MFLEQPGSEAGSSALSVNELRGRAGPQSTSFPGQWIGAPPPLLSTVARYAIAVLSIALAVLAAKAAVTYLQIEPFVSLLLCAIMFAAWFGGLGPGLLATALAVVAFDYDLIPPPHSFDVNLHELPRLGLFVAAALFVNWISAKQRSATRSLQHSHNELLAALESQRQVEEDLRRSEQRFRDFAETASDWFWETDRDHRLIRLSRESTAAQGGIGAAPWEFAADRDEEPEKWKNHFASLAARAPFRDFRYRAVRGDSAVVCLSVSGRPMFDAKGDFLGYRGVASDVTATVRAEQAEAALHEARTDLAHATRVITLGELTSSIAHEVNQPLTAILSNAAACLRWLDRGATGMESARRSAEWIVNDVNRAAEVIKRVRALAAKNAAEKSRFDINDVVNEVRALLRRELSSNNILLHLELAPDALVVVADRIQLQQVIINLVMNGIEAMQSVTEWPRELSIRSQRTETDQVLLAVKDCGAGFSDEAANRLFHAFFTTKPSGMGLGLSICRSIVEAHGGRLSASRNAGPGATFQITLPLQDNAA